MSTAATILSTAADLIETEGWAQGDYINGNGRCALGAIRSAGCGNAVVDPRQRPTQVWDAELELAAVIETRAIVDWNDNPERTKDDVVTALRTAAARAATTAGDRDE